MTGIEEGIASIERCGTLDDLSQALQTIIEARGFASFAFIDTSVPGKEAPLVIATNPEAWDREYRSNGFVHVDPVLPVARRTNTPFHWQNVILPERLGRKKSGALRTMEAARDHGFTSGLVIPFHYLDDLGIAYSSVCTFFWKDRLSQFKAMFTHQRLELHVILLYWAQRAVEIEAKNRSRPSRFLDAEGQPLRQVSITDRERDVLSWAGRGKIVSETAEILRLSEETVETHMRNAMSKLGANNKTHAVVKAIYLGLIDV
jgi:DNA-binding CsgD family transcriptional regulator